MWRAQLPCLPDLPALQRRQPQRFPFLLESVARHPQSGRWDLLLAEPEDSLSLQSGCLRDSRGQPPAGDFFAALDRWAGAEPAAPRDELPFCGGWFLYLGYEAARVVEPSLRLPDSPFGLPDALAVRCPAALLVDHARQCCYAVSERGQAQLDALCAAALDATPSSAVRPPALPARIREEVPQRYLDGVRRVLDYLRAGDVFQVNLSRRWDVQLDDRIGPVDVYARLRQCNAAPFAGLMLWQDAAVISSSPERLLNIDGDLVQTRPIAGTRRRGATAGEDAQLRAVLRDNLKERAEHIMLLDLQRNDLGRVCRPGSIEVNELMSLESYAHVHHIVSNVRGRLRPGIGAGAALRAVFPGGTITGCPKVRVMQIIAELEGEGRGPYTGSMGYLSRDGRLDTNILIRSMVWQRGQLSFRAGAGIVADSQPQAELQETRAKARGLLLALDAAA